MDSKYVFTLIFYVYYSIGIIFAVKPLFDIIFLRKNRDSRGYEIFIGSWAEIKTLPYFHRFLSIAIIFIGMVILLTISSLAWPYYLYESYTGNRSNQ